MAAALIVDERRALLDRAASCAGAARRPMGVPQHTGGGERHGTKGAGITGGLPRARAVDERLGIQIGVAAAVGQISHAYTHFRITLHSYRCSWLGGQPGPASYYTASAWVRAGGVGALTLFRLRI